MAKFWLTVWVVSRIGFDLFWKLTGLCLLTCMHLVQRQLSLISLQIKLVVDLTLCITIWSYWLNPLLQYRLYIKQPPSTSTSGYDDGPEWAEYKIKETNMFTVDKYQQVSILALHIFWVYLSFIYGKNKFLLSHFCAAEYPLQLVCRSVISQGRGHLLWDTRQLGC